MYTTNIHAYTLLAKEIYRHDGSWSIPIDDFYAYLDMHAIAYHHFFELRGERILDIAFRSDHFVFILMKAASV